MRVLQTTDDDDKCQRPSLVCPPPTLCVGGPVINLSNLCLCLPIRAVSLLMRGKLYRDCVQSCMLHGSDPWPVRKENKLALQQAKITMIWWMCSVKITDSFNELRERLAIYDISTVVQRNRLRCYLPSAVSP